MQKKKHSLSHLEIIDADCHSLASDLDLIDDHRESISQLCKRLETDSHTGLDIVEAYKRWLRDGPNLITPPKDIPEWRRLLQNMVGWFNVLLWGGAALCMFAYLFRLSQGSVKDPPDNLYLASFLSLVVFLSGCFSYYQEAKSYSLVDSFKSLIPRTATVIRSGIKLVVNIEELVVGDLIELKNGNQIPADVRIVKSLGLKVDQSMITGDKEPVDKTHRMTDSNALVTGNLAFYSTNCIAGTAKGIVIRTGDRLILGPFHELVSELENNTTPLFKDINRFIDIITWVTMSFAFLFAATSFFIHFSWIEAVVFFLSLVVAQVPEALLPTVTATLTLAAKRMVAKNCVVKNLRAVEMLGSTSTLCTDKTGTLTEDQIVVANVWINGKIIRAARVLQRDDKTNVELRRKSDLDSPAIRSFIRINCLCSRAEFAAGQARLRPLMRQTIGGPTESAILKYMEIITGCVASFRNRFPRVFEVPFDSNRMQHLVVNESSEDNGHWLSVKGAPEIVFNQCTSVLISGREVPIDDQLRQQFFDSLGQLLSQGELVIGLAEKFLSIERYPFGFAFDLNKDSLPLNKLRFVGLISMVNPPRTTVAEAVRKCRSAGIRVVMITGDHPVTAAVIGRAVGIISRDTREEIASRKKVPIHKIDQKMAKAVVVNGQDPKFYCPKRLDKILSTFEEIVVARATPALKLMVVEAFQRQKSVVAVTGHGGGDSLALKKADIGIAMGATGSDMCKEAADLILLDDNFSSIVAGIEEGRVIFDNLKKSICYTLSSKVPEMTPFMLYALIGLPLAMGAITILCTDLVTDMVPAISLAYEPAEVDVMKRRPRNIKTDKLVTRRLTFLSYGQIGMFQAAAGFFTYIVIMTEHGFFVSDLVGLRRDWDSPTIHDVTDSYGQEWSHSQRKKLELTCHTAFFVATVLTKWSALICCKTQRFSVFTQGMKNNVLTFALFFELGLALFLVYCPGMDKSLKMQPLHLSRWFLPLPFTVAFFIYDELRRRLMRKWPGGWLDQEMYY